MTRRSASLAVLVAAFCFLLTGCGTSKPLSAEVLAISSAGPEDLVVATRAGCPGCVDLWRWTGEWKRLAELHDPPAGADSVDGPLAVDALQMSPDGKHGYLNWARGTWQTRDGGRSWEPLRLPGRGGRVVAATGDFAIVSGDSLYRARLGTDRWKRIAPMAVEVTRRGDVLQALVLQGAGSSVLLSVDGGGSWTRRPVEKGCEATTAGVDGVAEACPVGNRSVKGRGYLTTYELRTSDDGRTWRPQGRYDTGLPEVVGISEDRFLLLGSPRGKHTRILAGGKLTKPELPRNANVSDADVVFVSDDVGFWRAGGDVLRSADGGRSWTVIAEAPEAS